MATELLTPLFRHPAGYRRWGWVLGLGFVCLLEVLSDASMSAQTTDSGPPSPPPPPPSATNVYSSAVSNAVPVASSGSNAPDSQASPTISTADTNSLDPITGEAVPDYRANFIEAQYLEKIGLLDQAERDLINLLVQEVPDPIRQSALFELGSVVRAENDLPRAISVNAQFLDKWPNDPRVPEVLLRQGQIYRQMGLNNLALTKFYAVMTAALSLKSDRPGYYPGLVLDAQIEIADTHFLMGRYSEAADFYTRLLKQDSPAMDRPQVQYRLIHSLAGVGRHEEAIGQARDFIARYSDAPQLPEVRFQLAQSLKLLGQNNEAMQQVLTLLKEEKAKTKEHPDLWAYWQQRAGNEIANQLYRDGDYMRALEIYINLAQLDPSPAWQLPVQYQIGLTYERLQQPDKAAEAYNTILRIEPVLGTNAPPGQKAVFDMARWRTGFLKWQDHAETANRAVAISLPPATDPSTNQTPATTP